MAGRPKGSIKKKEVYSKKLPENAVPYDDTEESSDKDDIIYSINDMLSGNKRHLKIWLTKIGVDNPEKALSIYKDFLEYIVPKQQRTDPKNGNTQPINIIFEPASKAQIKVEQPVNHQAGPKTSVIDELFSKK